MPSKEDDSMRVIVAVTRDGHPELFDELAKIPAKFRAERLRTMGLISLRGSTVPAAITAFPAHTIAQGSGDAVPVGSGDDDGVAERKRKEQEALMKKKLDFKNDLKL
jgi:hypothetical protein